MITHKAAVAARFNTVAGGHEHPALVHFRQAAGRLVELLQLQPGQRLLDVGCGTGLVTLEAARAIGPAGQVVGVDLASTMLERARRHAAQAGVTTVEFREMDGERLNFSNDAFDAVVGGFAIFFLPDMVAALREWRRVTRPGGLVGMSVFGRKAFEPMHSLYGARMGLEVDWHRTAEPEVCRDLLRAAGFDAIQVTAEQFGRAVDGPEGWWDVVRNLGTGAALTKLDVDDLARVKSEHFAEIGDVSWLDIPVIFALGRNGVA